MVWCFFSFVSQIFRGNNPATTKNIPNPRLRPCHYNIKKPKQTRNQFILSHKKAKRAQVFPQWWVSRKKGSNPFQFCITLHFILSLWAKCCGRAYQFRHHATLSWLHGLRARVGSHLDNWGLKLRNSLPSVMSMKTWAVKEAVFLLLSSHVWQLCGTKFQLRDVNIMCGLATFQSSNLYEESWPSFLQVGLPPLDPYWSCRISPGDHFSE